MLLEDTSITRFWTHLPAGTRHGESSEAISLLDWRLLQSQKKAPFLWKFCWV